MLAHYAIVRFARCAVQGLDGIMKKHWNALVSLIVVGALLTPITRAAYDSAATPKGDVQVARITPSGTDVPVGRQLVVTFDRPMKPVGNMQVAAEQSPVSITPTVDCNWHWLDPRSLACELAPQ